MPGIKNSTVEVDLELDLDSDEFESLLFSESADAYRGYRGSQEQLSHAGIPVSLFPGQPGRLKTISRFTINGSNAQLSRLQGRYARYELVWWIPDHLRAIVDPGIEAAMKCSLASPARFNVGDICMYWNPGHEGHGEKLEITSAFEFSRVRDPAGRFIDKDGDRIDYRWGYRAREIGGRPYFYAAYELLDIDHSIRHIRLVGASRSETNENTQFAA